MTSSAVWSCGCEPVGSVSTTLYPASQKLLWSLVPIGRILVVNSYPTCANATSAMKAATAFDLGSENTIP